MRQRVVRWLIPGGVHYPESHRRLRLFWWDGVLWNIGESLVIAYSTLYALALGATTAQIGQLTSVSNLFGAVALIPGAHVSEVWGQRKRMVFLFSAASRLALLFLALIPFFWSSTAAVYAVMAALAWRTFADNLAKPAGTSFIADIVPLRLRGRYFSSRNFAMGAVAFAIVPLVGVLIRGLGEISGYQLAWLISFVTAAIGAVCFAQIPEPEAPAHAAPMTMRELVKNVRYAQPFLAFTVAGLVWNLSLQVSAPFFNVFLVKDLGGTAAIIGVVQAINSMSALIGQRWFGARYGKMGDMGIFRLTGLVIPVLPFIWAGIQSPWHVGFINGIGGFMWAGYNLAQFNLLLSLTPERGRERFVAIYQTIVFFSACVAPLAGAWLVDVIGFRALFALSGAGRLAATLLFFRLIAARQGARQRRPSAAHSSD